MNLKNEIAHSAGLKFKVSYTLSLWEWILKINRAVVAATGSHLVADQACGSKWLWLFQWLNLVHCRTAQKSVYVPSPLHLIPISIMPAWRRQHSQVLFSFIKTWLNLGRKVQSRHQGDIPCCKQEPESGSLFQHPTWNQCDSHQPATATCYHMPDQPPGGFWWLPQWL